MFKGEWVEIWAGILAEFWFEVWISSLEFNFQVWIQNLSLNLKFESGILVSRSRFGAEVLGWIRWLWWGQSQIEVWARSLSLKFEFKVEIQCRSARNMSLEQSNCRIKGWDRDSQFQKLIFELEIWIQSSRNIGSRVRVRRSLKLESRLRAWTIKIRSNCRRDYRLQLEIWIY